MLWLDLNLTSMMRCRSWTKCTKTVKKETDVPHALHHFALFPVLNLMLYILISFLRPPEFDNDIDININRIYTSQQWTTIVW